ncbi:hypothetical protein ACFV4K_19320 [Nocardia sp. NPDC059764]|uniref:hypothetical protein n=1 Tax=Nocardia sp. NPDC059764 TaxID=3346939 RepID=UPI003663DFD6
MIEDSTRKADHHRVICRLKPKWGTYLLDEISQAEIQEWIVELQTTRAATTVQKYYPLLSNSMRLAQKAGLIQENPCVDIVLPKPGPSPERHLEEDEIAALRVPLDTLDALIVDILLGTGMRVGEAQGPRKEFSVQPNARIANVGRAQITTHQLAQHI